MIRFLLGPFVLLFLISCQQPDSGSISGTVEKIPHDYMFMQRAYPSGNIKSGAYSEASIWKNEQRRQRGDDPIWEFAGPLNIGGRITDIEIPIDQAQTYYVGTASGGIFKTIDAGSSWTPIFDDQGMLSIGDMEISEANPTHLWVGTGEVNAGGGSLAYDGNGIFKSEDGGITWQAKGLAASGSIGKILIDPTNDQTVYAAAMGPLFRNDTNRGVYKSTDNGATWEQKLFVSDSTGIIDMAIHPTNGNILYAASWERIRRPNRRQYGGETSGLYRSTDGGDTWAELTNGLPTLPSEKGRISIAISKSNPQVLVARYANATGGIQGVYRSADGGDSWATMNSSQLTDVGFHWWFRGIYIDPTNENTLYNVDFVVQKSVDGGASWFNAFPGVHVDQHALAFNTMVANEVLLGNDGGFYKSTNAGSSSVKNESLPITQFYRMHVDTQDANRVYGGAQDNSTMRTLTGELANWSIIHGGDGFQPLVDPTNSSVIYALSQNGNLVKSTNNGATFSGATNGISFADRNNWDTPVVLDPTNSQILYYGTQRLYRTTNAAGSWSPISPDLTDGPHQGNLTFGTITTIDVSTLNSNIIVVGTDDGNVQFSDNGGSSWSLVSASLPNRWVTKVLADRFNENTLYATFSGYRYGEDDGHVYKSENKGQSWVAISSNLPDIPVNDIVQDRYGNLFLATDIGVLSSKDNGVSWEPFGANMPSVVVTDMHLHEATEFLYVATYGRSMYKMDISEDILNNSDLASETSPKLYPNPATEVVTLETVRNEAMQVTVFDALGRTVKTERFSGSSGKYQISLQGLAPGIYYVGTQQEGKRYTHKLIVQR
ncbi:MAG: hypothetical protein CMC08_06150 [Flavobacteriaceae bacterium]|nr:hypothetical protein [Flavobacteriaceae bacterium]